MKNIMVINMGLKSIRCIVFDQEGRKLCGEAMAIKTAIDAERVEQDPKEWWSKAEQIISKVTGEYKDIFIDYITVTASASCLVCVDRKGTPLANAFMVSDKRAEAESRYISERKEYLEICGKNRMRMSSSLMLPRILWIKNHMPEVFNRTYKFLSPNDFILSKLSGLYVTDYLNAMKYHYNVQERTYPEKLLEALGIACEKLPEITEPGQAVADIRPELAEKLAIKKSAKIIVTSYDAICSFFGSGISEDGEASDVSGTVTVLRVLAKGSNKRENPAVYSLPFYQEQASIIGGSNNLGGGLIEWVKQCFYQNEIYPYEVMEKEAGESALGAKGLIFLPYLLGERMPVWDNDARGVFFGIERMHTRKDMARAVYESTGFIDMDMIKAIEETGTRIKSVRLSGGLARINLISQLKADILGREVSVLSEFETTSTGAAMLALTGQGIFKNLKQAAERFATIRMIIRPNMENHEKYMEMYALYKDTYETVKELYVRRKKTVRAIGNDREVRIENL